MSQYKIHNDGDGHEYLIPYGIWALFCSKLEKLESQMLIDGDDQPINDYLENFEQLNGREYVIFLEEDLEKDYK